MNRTLEWDGCVNVRDLGGLATEGGGLTGFGKVVRSDNPSRLTSDGWRTAEDYGVTTVVTLRTIGTEDDEPDPALVPPSIVVERVFVEDLTDPEFRRRCVDTGWWSTPLQWVEMLRSWPEMCAAAVGAAVRSPPGVVVISCGIGRDRTGLAAFLLLALAGVPAEAIGEDWSLSLANLDGDPLAANDEVTEVLERASATVLGGVEAALDLGVEDRLLAGGLTPSELDTARRLLRS